jgi:hypothetical protein
VFELSWDQVLAFRLERQFLTEHAPKGSLLSVASALCGLHAQVASSPELALRARVDGLAHGDVERALEDERSLVKTWTIRDTLHLVPAEDLPLYVGVLRPHPDGPGDGWMRQRGITREQYHAIIENVPRALTGRPQTRESLADRLVELAGADVREAALTTWGGVLKVSAHLGDLCFGPNRGRNVTFVRPDRWLKRTLSVMDRDQARREFMRRCLGTYGVASYDDMYRWLEHSRVAKELLESSGDELVEVKVEGRRAWAHEHDLDELAARRRPRGVHLLPAFDPFVMGPRPREAFVPAEQMRRVFRPQGRVTPVVIVDGRAAGIWSHEVRGARLRVDVQAFAPFRPRVGKALADEVERMAAFFGCTSDLSVVD